MLTSLLAAFILASHEAMIQAIEGRRADDAEQLAGEHMARAMEVRIRLLRDGADPRTVDLVS